jgi:hypothetical protein
MNNSINYYKNITILILDKKKRLIKHTQYAGVDLGEIGEVS